MVKPFDQVTKPNRVSPPENRRFTLTCSELNFAWPTGSATPPGAGPPKKTPVPVVTAVYCGKGLSDWYTVLAPLCDAKLGHGEEKPAAVAAAGVRGCKRRLPY